MIPGTPVGDTLALHGNYMLNKAGTRIKCLGDGCGSVVPVVAVAFGDAAGEAYAGHLLDVLSRSAAQRDAWAEPEF